MRILGFEVSMEQPRNGQSEPRDSQSGDSWNSRHDSWGRDTLELVTPIMHASVIDKRKVRQPKSAYIPSLSWLDLPGIIDGKLSESESRSSLENKHGKWIHDSSFPPWVLSNLSLYEMLPIESIFLLSGLGLTLSVPSADQNPLTLWMVAHRSQYKSILYSTMKIWGYIIASSFSLFFIYESYLFITFFIHVKAFGALYILCRLVSYPAVLFQMAVQMPTVIAIRSRLASKSSAVEIPLLENLIRVV